MTHNPSMLLEALRHPSPERLSRCAVNLGTIAIQATDITYQLHAKDRKPILPNGYAERDDTHTLVLVNVASEICAQIYPELNKADVARFAKDHELPEIVTGDTQTLYLTPEERAVKELREQQAIAELMDDLPPEMQRNLEEYGRQDTPEARFVRAVDKLLPYITNVLGQGERVMHESYGVYGLEKLQELHDQNFAKFVADFGEEFPELVELYALLAHQFEQKFASQEEQQPAHEQPGRIECKRKYLVDKNTLPFSLDQFKKVTIRQGFLNTDDGEMSIRALNETNFQIFVKSSGTELRQNQTTVISHQMFEEMWPLTAARRLER